MNRYDYYYARPRFQRVSPPATSSPIPSQVQPQAQQDPVQELRKAVHNAHEMIFAATTVFPFTLIPDTITIDREKLTIATRIFFRVAEVVSIRIEDILNVTADVGPFFGSIKIYTRFFDPDKPYHINFLWRGDTLKIKRILQGYIVAAQSGIDCSSLPREQLVRVLDEIGQGAPSKDM
jgi:hypothetical protein